MRKDAIELAIQKTTGPGEPKPNVYRIASWLNAQGYLVFMSEIREALGVASDQIDQEVASGIGSLLIAEQKMSEKR